MFGLADLVSLIYFKWLIMAQFFIAMGVNRKVNNVQTILCNQFEVINSYCKCLKVIEPLEFESLELESIKSRLFDGKHSALPAMNKLSWLLNAFENRRHIYVSFVRNALFMYDLILMYYLEKWKTKNKDSIHKWIDDITTMEVLVSLGGFAELNPEFCYPEVTNHCILKSENLGHPLIPVEKRVCNDFYIEKNKSIFILTGANMSGKSTFLRTLGINLILAMMGAPVCASSFEFKPQKIRTRIKRFIESPSISVNKITCSKCGLCIRICPVRIFRAINEDPVATTTTNHLEECVLCGQCLSACSTNSIIHTGFLSANFQRILHRKPVTPEVAFEFLSQRRSVRNYKKEIPSSELLEKIINIAGYAPGSPHHRVGWVRNITVVSGSANMKVIADMTAEYVQKIHSVLTSSFIKLVARFSESARAGIGVVPDLQMRLNEYRNGKDLIIYNAPVANFCSCSDEIINTPRQSIIKTVYKTLLSYS